MQVQESRVWGGHEVDGAPGSGARTRLERFISRPWCTPDTNTNRREPGSGDRERGAVRGKTGLLHYIDCDDESSSSTSSGPSRSVHCAFCSRTFYRYTWETLSSHPERTIGSAWETPTRCNFFSPKFVSTDYVCLQFHAVSALGRCGSRKKAVNRTTRELVGGPMAC